MSGEANIKYPSQYATEELLKDGSRIILRPIKRNDAEHWLAFIRGLSHRTKYLRFHSPLKIRLEHAIQMCRVDYINTFAFVAEIIKEQHLDIIAIGRYHRLPGKNSAEVAFVIEDTYQGKGIGTVLMKWLVNVARDNGITTFEASVLAENKEMMTVFRDYGFHITNKHEGSVYHVTFPIARTKSVFKKEEERERIATVVSLSSLLYPRSIAVIGASRNPDSIGQLPFQCIMQNGFSGVVYPVNPNAEAVMSVKAYPSVLDVPGSVDLALIIVPTRFVPEVTDECGRKGVNTVIVISDGFKETGPEGAERERELRAIALGHGMRLVGPNCMGVINTDPAIKLNASFSKVYPPRGNVALLSQSGMLGLVVLEYAKTLNMGISTFVSVGNRADISSNDLLQYWEQDPATRVILLYLESFGNPRKFARIARKVSTTKPIVVVKGGTSPAGSRAASLHTGFLASPEIASDALFRQAGIIRVDTLEELFDVATMLSNQPIPKGNRVAIVTNGGGPGILAADTCEHHGLALSEFTPEIVKELRSVSKHAIRMHNPLDLTGSATREEYEDILKLLARDKNNDAVIIIFVTAAIVSPKAIEDAIQRVAPAYLRQGKPLLACFMGQRGFKTKLSFRDKFVPSYPFPEAAVLALSRAAEYGEWVRKPKGTIPKIRGIKRERARKIIETAMTQSAERPLWLSPKETTNLLGCYGIRFAETLMARTAAGATAAASTVGFPVAVKLSSSTIVHKTDVGGVKLDLESKIAVKRAFNDIKSGLSKTGRQHEMEGVAVQHMVKGGIETIVGVTQDPSFGPLIMFGLGGIYAELIKDVAVRLHPLTDSDARELVRSIKMSNLLDGFRGSPPSDTESLEDLLLRLSALIEDMPQIAELDFNPVKVMPRGEGYWIVDARIMLR
ncbi:MAG: GNAT family N-acetyltransferase [Deltaproteobacteria bacterium]|nr:GNAT family N-acetyltransferase [Deltaproteobacteria bacterium]